MSHSPLGITKDTIVIKEIVIESPEVTYELARGGSNIDALQRNISHEMQESLAPRYQSEIGQSIMIECEIFFDDELPLQ